MADIAYAVLLLVIVAMMLGVIEIPEPPQKRARRLPSRCVSEPVPAAPRASAEVVRLRDKFRSRLVPRTPPERR